jgi:hypothetical protein
MPDLPSIGAEIIVGLIVALFMSMLVSVGTIAARRASTPILRLTRYVARVGLPLVAQRYIDSWFASWEYEAREALKADGTVGLSRELFLLARVFSLPLYLKILREDATHRLVKFQPTGMGNGAMVFGDGTVYHVNYQVLPDPKASPGTPLPHFPAYLVNQVAPTLAHLSPAQRASEMERLLPGTRVRQIAGEQADCWQREVVQ